MKLGVSLSSSLPVDGPKLMIERAGAAHAAGFSSLSLGDHHNMEVPYAQNTPMLGRLLAQWRSRPAGCLFLVPLWHPVLMAEQIGTLAAIHDGRFIVQTGIGYGSSQFAAMGAEMTTRGRVTEATIEAVKAMLDGEVVDDDRLGLVEGRVGLRPDGPVEWWIGGHADVALRRAATMGDAWYAGPSIMPDATGMAMIDTYRSAGGSRVVLRKDALVLADGDRARAKAEELVAAGYRGMTMDHLLVGDPDDVAAQLSPYAEAGIDEITIRCMSTDQAEALETLTLLGPLGTG